MAMDRRRNRRGKPVRNLVHVAMACAGGDTMTPYSKIVSTYLLSDRALRNCLQTCVAYSHDKDRAARVAYGALQSSGVTHTQCGKRITRWQIRLAMRLLS